MTYETTVQELRSYAGAGFMRPDMVSRVPYGCLYRWASLVEQLDTGYDEQQAAADGEIERLKGRVTELEAQLSTALEAAGIEPRIWVD